MCNSWKEKYYFCKITWIDIVWRCRDADSNENDMKPAEDAQMYKDSKVVGHLQVMMQIC